MGGRVRHAVGMETLKTMTSDLDIYRSANVLIKQHGSKAPIHAAIRADEMLEAGAMEGKAVWVRIMKAVEEWTRTSEGGTEFD